MRLTRTQRIRCTLGNHLWRDDSTKWGSNRTCVRCGIRSIREAQ